jgi:hypothetical protein
VRCETARSLRQAGLNRSCCLPVPYVERLIGTVRRECLDQRRLFRLGARLWRTDNSFKRLPARASLLYARSITPVGGHTQFADERAAYDALPAEMKRRLETLVAEHSIFN